MPRNPGMGESSAGQSSPRLGMGGPKVVISPRSMELLRPAVQPTEPIT